MNAQTPVKVPTGLDLLRQPFPAHQISKLPKETRAQIDARKADKGLMVWKCEVCGGPHHKNAVHLDYVGHAALTDRLLEADPEWSWEPVAFGPDGLPVLDRNGGLWIKLTVCGVTRLGYGDAEGKTGGNAIKEAIGDALRNAAMRFGAALDLWHKGDLHLEAEDGGAGTQAEAEVSPAAPKAPAHSKLKTEVRQFVRELQGCGDADELTAFLATADALRIVREVKDKMPDWWEGSPDMPAEFVPLSTLITQRQHECAQATANYMTA